MKTEHDPIDDNDLQRVIRGVFALINYNTLCIMQLLKESDSENTNTSLQEITQYAENIRNLSAGTLDTLLVITKDKQDTEPG